jgi:excinuclease UvrABC nuclease subunit
MTVDTVQKVVWSSYEFGVYTPTTTWNSVSGIYIFSGLDANNRWVALYIGQANSFAERLPGHERWSDAKQLGATHIHAMVVSTQEMRDKIEALLIQNFQPRLNSQLR